MTNFVDMVRSLPPAQAKRRRITGFDPDTQVFGWATISTEMCDGLQLRVTDVSLFTGTHEGITGNRERRKGKHQAYSVAAGLRGLLDLQESFIAAHVVIESQDFYPKPNEARATMVSKANALIGLAHVSGAAHALAIQYGGTPHIVAPSEWKAQRTKTADHLRSARILRDNKVTVRAGGDTHETKDPEAFLTSLPAAWEHALDALGMALYGADRLHRGVWS